MIATGLYYTSEHEWLKVEGAKATIGITDHAQELLGDVTFIELTPAGEKVKAQGVVASVESSKAASDVYCPLAGEIVEVNETLADQPELINQDCYQAGWICKVKLNEPGKVKELMDAKAYEAYVASL